MDVLGESDVIQETSYASAVGHITSQAGALSPRGPRMGMQGIAPMKLPPQVTVDLKNIGNNTLGGRQRNAALCTSCMGTGKSDDYVRWCEACAGGGCQYAEDGPAAGNVNRTPVKIGTSNGGSAPSATMNAYPTPLTSPRTTTTVSSMLTPRSAAGNNAQAGNGKENFITNGVKNGTMKMSKGYADLKKGVKNLFTPTLF